MRVLHTSDWHLGRSFHREGLLDAQSRFVDHVVEVVRSEGVDVVAVSGDIFDRALPPVDAVQIAGDALRRLMAAQVRVIMTSGNHDSGPRLGFAADLIDEAGVHIRTDPAGVGAPVLMADDSGDVAFYPLPYLEPDLVKEPWQLPGRSHQVVLDEAMARVRADLATRPDTRSVVLSHAFVVGARPSDSERDISVGGVAGVGLDTFADIDYVALGHLHGRHTMTDSIRYSGSPLAYSFSEAGHLKGSWLVDLGPSGLQTAEFVEAPVPRALATLRGSLTDLLSDPRHDDAARCWVQATLTDAIRPVHALERLRTRFPHTLVVQFDPDAKAVGSTTAPLVGPNISTANDLDIVTSFFTDVRDAAPTGDELRLLADACDACRVDEDEAAS